MQNVSVCITKLSKMYGERQSSVRRGNIAFVNLRQISDTEPKYVRVCRLQLSTKSNKCIWSVFRCKAFGFGCHLTAGDSLGAVCTSEADRG